jgi:hypothetical protein
MQSEHKGMTRYITRVELRGSPTSKDYENLHAKMRAKGFERTIRGGDGKVYQLPHAEYYVESTLTTGQVMNHADEVAHSVWTKCSVITSDAPNSSWKGLDLA